MKVKNAAESWWCLRECWCHKIPRSLDRRAEPGKVGRPGNFSRPIWPWPELRSAADPAICFHSDDFPQSIKCTFFTYTFHPACCYGLSQKTLWPSSNSQNPSGLTSCLVSSSYLVSPEQPEKIMGRGYVEIFRSAPHREGLMGSSSHWAPSLSHAVGFMAWAEEGRRCRLRETRGMGCVGCETI